MLVVLWAMEPKGVEFIDSDGSDCYYQRDFGNMYMCQDHNSSIPVKVVFRTFSSDATRRNIEDKLEGGK
jgi:hypothetical protein